MESCRDIETNQIVESDAGEITDSGFEIRTESSLPKIILNDEQTSYVEFGILGLIGIIGGIIGVSRKEIGSAIFQKRGWSIDEKEQVRTRQHGRCNMCYREPSRLVYDHFDGDKRNNDISNCQGLCPECKSEKMMISI